MAGGLGGILINKSAGWLFDAYRSAGIAKSWVEAKAADLGAYVDQIKSLTLKNSHGDIINLDKVEVNHLPKDVANQLMSIDPTQFQQLKTLQAGLVQGEMTIAYTYVFIYCALAYVIAWVIMKSLVPKFKPINDL